MMNMLFTPPICDIQVKQLVAMALENLQCKC